MEQLRRNIEEIDRVPVCGYSNKLATPPRRASTGVAGRALHRDGQRLRRQCLLRRGRSSARANLSR
jgi:hypothetical protein